MKLHRVGLARTGLSKGEGEIGMKEGVWELDRERSKHGTTGYTQDRSNKWERERRVAKGVLVKGKEVLLRE